MRLFIPSFPMVAGAVSIALAINESKILIHQPGLVNLSGGSLIPKRTVMIT